MNESPHDSQEATGWITEADGALFAQDSKATNQIAQGDAYRTLAMQDGVSNILGFDTNLSEVVIEDVRSQPTNADGSCATTDSAGHVPNMTAVLLKSQQLIIENHVIYFIVDGQLLRSGGLPVGS